MHYDTGYVYVVIGGKLRISQVKRRVQNFFSAEFTLSKRMLGILLISGGILGFVGISPVNETLIGGVDGLGAQGVQRWLDKLHKLGRDAG